MKKQLEDSINLISQVLSGNNIEPEQRTKLLTVLGTLQGLLIIQTIMP